MKTANVSLRNMTLAMLLTGVVGSAWAAGTTPTTSPLAALSAAAGVPSADAPAVAPVSAVAPAGDDVTETTLKKASELQAKYALQKIQSDIDKLNSPNGGNGGGIASPIATGNPMDALRAASPSATALSALPAARPAPTPASTMKAIGTYTSGNSAYADLLVNDSRTVAVPGATLSNGYLVDSIGVNGVTVSKGKQHLVLPVVPGPAQAMASGGSTMATVGSAVGGDMGLQNRFNQLTGPGTMPSPMIIPQMTGTR